MNFSGNPDAQTSSRIQHSSGQTPATSSSPASTQPPCSPMGKLTIQYESVGHRDLSFLLNSARRITAMPKEMAIPTRRMALNSSSSCAKAILHMACRCRMQTGETNVAPDSNERVNRSSRCTGGPRSKVTATVGALHWKTGRERKAPSLPPKSPRWVDQTPDTQPNQLPWNAMR